MLPGLYYISALQNQGRELKYGTPAYGSTDLLSQQGKSAYVAQAYGVPVTAQGANRFQMRLQHLMAPAIVNIKLPDGRPYERSSKKKYIYISSQAASPQDKPIDRLSERDRRSLSELQLASGMNRITFRQLGTSADQIAHAANGKKKETLEETEQAAIYGVAVISNALHQKHEEIELNTYYPNSGLLRLQMQDANGKPVLAQASGDYVSTDKTHDVEGGNTHQVSANASTVTATTTDETWGRFNNYNGQEGIEPFPSDEELIQHPVWIKKTISILPGATKSAVLRAEPVGYLRGKIKATFVRNRRFHVYAKNIDRFRVRSYYDSSNDEYLIGPLPPGKATVRYSWRDGGLDKTITVAAGKVTHFDWGLDSSLAVVPEKGKESEKIPMFQGTPDTWERYTPDSKKPLEAQILLPGGKQPAVGACIFIWDTHSSSMIRPDMDGGSENRDSVPKYFTDGNGQLRQGNITKPRAYTDFVPFSQYDYWSVADTEDPIPMEYLRNKRVLVAFLPGLHGASFLMLPKGAEEITHKIVLPPSLSIKGQISIGGKLFGPQVPGAIKVLARCTGHGPLNELLSVEATAQSDGTFSLSGLTPGKYILQACLDDVWTSSPIIVTVQPGNTPPVMKLNIAAPGKPVSISLDRKYVGTRVEWIDAPLSGPLDERYRSAFYVVDGIGKLRLEGLPAGKHQFRLADDKTITVNITALENK